MHIACLCPTYGRPSLVANSLALFLGQQLRHGDTAHLTILDDADQISAQTCASGPLTWSVTPVRAWIPLPRKYAYLVWLARPADVYVVWDDDDVYLPWHLSSVAAATPRAGWSHPAYVWSTCGVDPQAEAPRREIATGRFHGAMAVGAELLALVGGWPDTLQATYDQEMLARLTAAAGPPHDLCTVAEPSYVYRWGDTGKHHCSGSIDERGEYRRPPIQEPGQVDVLRPAYDASTRTLLIWAAAVSQP